MELRQLEYLVTVAEEANFTRAAARLHVTQPGVSAQIRLLERELGQPLLDRSARSVRLTEAGAAVLPHARAALTAAASCQLAVEELSGLRRGHVSVGMLSSDPFEMASLLADFHDRHPAIEITLTEATSDQLLDALVSGQLDMALIGSVAGRPPGVATQVVTDELLVAAVSHGDPLANGTSIALQALVQRALISLPRGTGLRTRFERACASVGARPRIAFEAGHPQVLGQLAARGLGVAILPRSFIAAHPGLLHALEITHPRIRAQIELAWRAEGHLSPAARALIGHARRSLPDLPAD